MFLKEITMLVSALIWEQALNEDFISGEYIDSANFLWSLWGVQRPRSHIRPDSTHEEYVRVYEYTCITKKHTSYTCVCSALFVL